MRPLRIAVAKARLQRPTLRAFAAAGLEVPTDPELSSRKLLFRKGTVEWVFIKDGDVPVYVQFGAADAGVVGLDQLLEHEADVYQPVSFEFGACHMMLIAAADAPPLGPASRTRLATKYPNVARRFLESERLHLEVVALQGSVELAAVLGFAPYIIDLVDTGETVRQHNLRLVREITRITPRLIVNKAAYQLDRTRIRRLISSLEERAAVETSP